MLGDEEPLNPRQCGTSAPTAGSTTASSTRPQRLGPSVKDGTATEGVATEQIPGGTHEEEERGAFFFLATRRINRVYAGHE